MWLKFQLLPPKCFVKQKLSASDPPVSSIRQFTGSKVRTVVIRYVYTKRGFALSTSSEPRLYREKCRETGKGINSIVELQIKVHNYLREWHLFCFFAKVYQHLD